MGRNRSRCLYVVVEAQLLHWIDKERNLEPGVELKESFADDLYCPIGDPLLKALRRAFSLTYPTNPFVEGMSEAITEIRRIGIETLIEMPEVLDDLALKPIPRPLLEPPPKGDVFLYYLVKASDLRISVIYEKRKKSLRNLVETYPADVLVRTLRALVSDSFAEMHAEQEHRAVLNDMRSKVWAVLPAYNGLLREIEVEPIAELVEDEESQELD